MQAALIEVIVADFLNHILARHQGEISTALLEKLNESFQFYTKTALGSGKWAGPEPATYNRAKSDVFYAWLNIYGAISARLYVFPPWHKIVFLHSASNAHSTLS